MKLYEALGNKFLVASVMQNIGANFNSLGNYASAYDWFKKALDLGKETGNKKIIAHALMNIGSNYSAQKDQKQAIVYETEALRMFEEIGDKLSIATVTGNLGDNYLFQKNYQKAYEFQKKALKMSIEIGEKTVQAWNLYNISNTFLSFVTDTPAMQSVARGEHIFGSDINSADAVPTSRQALLHGSKDYALQALALANETEAADLVSKCYQNLSNTAMLGGDYKTALEYANKSHALNDSIFSKANNDKIAQLSADYDLEKKQNRITVLEKDSELNTIKIRQQVWQRNAIVVSAILVLVLAVAFFMVRLQRNRKDMQVAFSRSLIQNQERERQRISRELHDSIGQNILFIKNQLSDQKSNPALGPVMETIGATIEEVRNIYKELYPNQLEKYGLAAAVDTLAEKAHDTTGIFASADLQEIGGDLPKEVSINLYRIIQECLNNTIKHADAKAVRVTATKSDGKIILSIVDNGRGFDMAMLARKSQSSSGLLNIEERSKMLGGKMELESGASGTKITIIIPISNEV